MPEIQHPTQAELDQHMATFFAQQAQVETPAMPAAAVPAERFTPAFSMPLEGLRGNVGEPVTADERDSDSRHHGKLIAGVAAIAIVAIAGVAGPRLLSPDARPTTKKDQPHSVAGKPAVVRKSSVAAKPSRTAITPASYAFKAVPKSTIANIPVAVVEPLTQIVSLQGDPHPYSFGPEIADNSVFKSSVQGTIKLQVAITNPNAFVVDKALTATNHIPTYDPVLSAVGINIDYSGLTASNKIANNAAFLTGLCEAKEQQAKLSLTPVPLKTSTIPVCVEAYQYQHGNSPVSNELNAANAQLRSEKAAIGTAQVAETLHLLDVQAPAVQAVVEKYMVTQFRKMTAEVPAGKIALAAFKGNIAHFADPFIAQNPAVNSEIDGPLAAHLTQLLAAYITTQKAAKHPVPTDAETLRMIYSTKNPTAAAALPKFSICDDSRYFTPSINVPSA